jgi:hypothetical protein
LARLRAALIGATVLALAGTAAAQSKVGVTSATDGDPLGKPPAQAERILKIGIDVQANEVVTTHANDRAHLVFLDGSSLTVGPNARLTVDKFVYDPNSKTGELALTATQGVFRLVGGKISKTNPITINTPSGTIGIRGGITIFNVSNSRTVANFIFGHNLTMSSQGVSQNVTRAGSFVIANAGATPSPPSLLPPGGLNALVGQLEGGGSSTGGGTGGGGAGGSGSGTGGNADQKSQSSGFSSNNSGSGGSGAPPAINNPPNAIPGNPTGNPNITTQPIANSNKADNPTATQVFVPPTTVTTQVQTGYTNGLIIGTNGSIVTTRLPAIDANLPTDFAIATASVSGPFGTAGAAAARIIIRGLDGTLSSPNATLQLGGSTTNSTFFNDSNYATADVNRQGTVQPIGSSTTLQHDTTLVSLAANQLAATPVTPPIPQGFGTGKCECAYLSFGYWSSTISYNGTYRTGQTDSIATAPYVVGTVANPVMLPNTQSATYTGFMAGMAQLGSNNAYFATGDMTINWSFNRGAGSVGGTFDNKAYSGALAITPGTPNVSGQIQMTGGPSVSGPLTGSFFSSPTDPAKYIAGAFGVKGTVSGTPYAAGGVFATQR